MPELPAKTPVLARLDELIVQGSGVIRSSVPDAPDHRTVDLAAFQQWQTSCLFFLRTTFGSSSVHFLSFVANCKIQTYGDAVCGLAVLKAAEEDMNAGLDLSVAGARIDIEQLPLHPRIDSVAVDLYRDGHFDNAVLDASKALINFVKERSRRDDLDGAGLMRTVFSRNAPILAFNDLSHQSELDEQEGMMHFYEGVALGIRNPGAHDFPEMSADRALEYICLISMLANRLEETHSSQ